MDVSCGLARETGLSINSFPSIQTTKVSPKREQIPIYAADGTSLGFRSLEAAKRLIESGYVKPAYGRKGHLKAIWLLQKDGGNPVETHARAGTHYSFRENLDHGRCWKLRRLDWRDEDGAPFRIREAFLRVLTDCLTP